MIAWPMGLPDYDPVRQILEDRDALEGAAQLQHLDADATCLWCCSKEMQREKLLSDYVGRNEKTKVVAKLQKKGAGAPQRELPHAPAQDNPNEPGVPAAWADAGDGEARVRFTCVLCIALTLQNCDFVAA